MRGAGLPASRAPAVCNRLKQDELRHARGAPGEIAATGVFNDRLAGLRVIRSRNGPQRRHPLARSRSAGAPSAGRGSCRGGIQRLHGHAMLELTPGMRLTGALLA